VVEQMRNGILMRLILLLLPCLIVINSAMAADEDGLDGSADVDQISAEIEKKASKPRLQENVTRDNKPLKEFSGLGKLAPFSEISVIQKRFLPKTERFEIFGALTNVVNDPWFSLVGLDLRFGYHFTEAWSLELQGVSVQSSSRDSVKDLREKHGVGTESLVSIKGYTGLSAVWTPIYGKMGMLDKKIVPFDMYFAVGGGSTELEAGTGGSTLHLGTGQIFALSKAWGFRWDFAWNFVSATPNAGGSQNFNNLLLSFGASFFFPEAKYR
jgi:outer membrane beta-barrel protein